MGGSEALHSIRQSNIQKGDVILINGAGGSIGTIAVQLSINLGAYVIGVDRKQKLDMLRSLGVDKVIDYQIEDFTDTGVRYDIIFDIVGKSDFSSCLMSLNDGGRYIISNAGPFKALRSRIASLTGNKKVLTGPADLNPSDLAYLKDLLEKGKTKRIIDRISKFEEIPEAHEYVEKGFKKGNVVIDIAKQDS